MKKIIVISIIYLILTTNADANSWKFVVLGDTHVPSSDTLNEMIPFIEKENPDFVFVQGDLVDGGLKCTSSELLTQLTTWKSIFEPLTQKGIKIYAIRGNHENDTKNNINAWKQAFINEWELPQNGPYGEEGLTYSFIHKNAKLIGLDNYINLHKINQNWLNNELNSSEQAHIFVFAHEASFKVFHTDCLDDSLNARDEFWESLSESGVKAFFCGHDHFYNVSRIDDGDDNPENDVYQCLVGSGGGWLMPKHNFNGNNSKYTPIELIHVVDHGFSVIEISGETNHDLQVKMSWHIRKNDTLNKIVTYERINEEIQYTSPRIITDCSDVNFGTILLSPNPASEYIEISAFINPRVNPWVDNNIGSDIKIYNTYCECVMTVEMKNFSSLQRIDISHLPIGLYCIQIGNYSEKFVVVR